MKLWICTFPGSGEHASIARTVADEVSLLSLGRNYFTLP